MASERLELLPDRMTSMFPPESPHEQQHKLFRSLGSLEGRHKIKIHVSGIVCHIEIYGAFGLVFDVDAEDIRHKRQHRICDILCTFAQQLFQPTLQPLFDMRCQIVVTHNPFAQNLDTLCDDFLLIEPTYDLYHIIDQVHPRIFFL